jgi:hypothetical protein
MGAQKYEEPENFYSSGESSTFNFLPLGKFTFPFYLNQRFFKGRME